MVKTRRESTKDEAREGRFGKSNQQRGGRQGKSAGDDRNKKFDRSAGGDKNRKFDKSAGDDRNKKFDRSAGGDKNRKFDKSAGDDRNKKFDRSAGGDKNRRSDRSTGDGRSKKFNRSAGGERRGKSANSRYNSEAEEQSVAKSESDKFLLREKKDGGKVFKAKPRYGDKPKTNFASRGNSSRQDGSSRINKFIANAGICSRRDADIFIQSGAVTINGEVVTELGTRVMPDDVVNFEGTRISTENKVYILLNKPKGFVTTEKRTPNDKNVMDLVKNACHERIYPVGKLDKDTTGLLLFTNDGELTRDLTHPKYNRKKIYHVFCDKKVTKEHISTILNGVELEDGFVKADAVSYVDNEDLAQVGIEIHSGKNQIVRRIFAKLGYKALKLDRVYFCGLTKLNLPRGKWRRVTEEQVRMLRSGKF